MTFLLSCWSLLGATIGLGLMPMWLEDHWTPNRAKSLAVFLLSSLLTSLLALLDEREICAFIYSCLHHFSSQWQLGTGNLTPELEDSPQYVMLLMLLNGPLGPLTLLASVVEYQPDKKRHDSLYESRFIDKKGRTMSRSDNWNLGLGIWGSRQFGCQPTTTWISLGWWPPGAYQSIWNPASAGVLRQSLMKNSFYQRGLTPVIP